MSTLRRRLEDALAEHTGSDGPGSGVPADATLAVFAEWLRERAEVALNDPNQSENDVVSGYIAALAGELDPGRETV